MISDFDEEMLKAAADEKIRKFLMYCNFGLEKENIRTDENGTFAFTPHPKNFGDRMKNPYIKTDFSESQVEMATPIAHTTNEVYDLLEKIHDKVSREINNEYLWPQSTPPDIPDGREIPIANMGDNEEEKFRYVLAARYGRKQQLFCGIHYNFSFQEDYLKILYNKLSHGEEYTEFKNNIYLKICRNFMKYRWLLIYLTGASPVFHKSFVKKYVEESTKLNDETCCFPYMISLRNSDYGYKNKESYYVPFNSVNNYVKSIDKLSHDGKLQDICEFYGPIRLKTGNNDNLSHELIEYGIKYIEIRIFDLNPLFKIGINKDILNFTHLFILYMLFKNDEEFSEQDHEISNINSQLCSFYGRKNNTVIYEKNNIKVPFVKKAEQILNSMQEMLKLLNIKDEYLTDIIKEAGNMVQNADKTFAGQIIQSVKKESFINFHMKCAKKYRKF